MRSHIILRRDLFWTSVSSLIENQGRGCLDSGGRRTNWNWRDQRRGGAKRGGGIGAGRDDGPVMRSGNNK